MNADADFLDRLAKRISDALYFDRVGSIGINGNVLPGLLHDDYDKLRELAKRLRGEEGQDGPRDGPLDAAVAGAMSRDYRDVFGPRKPEGILVAPDGVTQDEMQRQREEWLGAIADGKPPILRKGWRWEPIDPVFTAGRPLAERMNDATSFLTVIAAILLIVFVVLMLGASILTMGAC